MFQEFFARSPLLFLPLVSLALFGAFFVLVVTYVLRRGRSLEARAMLPLENETDHE